MSTPDIRGGLDLNQFVSEDHAVLGTGGSRQLVNDQELAPQGIGRRVALTIPSFLGAAFVIERTDLPMTIPRRRVRRLPAALSHPETRREAAPAPALPS